MRDYMDSQVTPPNRVTSPAWGAPLKVQLLRPLQKVSLARPIKSNYSNM